ncbi:exopolysaccharide biosynthesis protein [Marinobacter orientalis]|uniref:Exopolysaccharide biosynthesis protein n=1 Tax=Marinobacter orientalis TaxID=1928859 RepID=A0A7Y0NJK3_9GAMM|nr:exopolysaccharide biosynthesis protein [Marinobacter orientalis]NMT62666.1 exopolysaccharide biosynthesis protein [Marinobacter orientalis]TGX51353.1 exopolysaccharide biosynthesis protein [Marinobacter orientalis]
MDNHREPADIEELLDRIEAGSTDRSHVSIGEMMDSVGRRTFGPIVLMVGLILVTPLSGVPGMPTLMGMLTLLTLGQVLIGRKHFWLPDFLVQRQIPRDKLVQGLEMLRLPARHIDRLIRPRLVFLVKGFGLYVMTLACMIIGVVMPATELVPFSSSIAGLALMMFGLAMISRDGFLALFAWTIALAGPVMLVRIA